MSMLDPRPHGVRARAAQPSSSRVREIRAARQREQKYREYADYMRAYSESPPPLAGTGVTLAGLGYFAGLGGYPKHLADAGGSGATLPEMATVDPIEYANGAVDSMRQRSMFVNNDGSTNWAMVVGLSAGGVAAIFVAKRLILGKW